MADESGATSSPPTRRRGKRGLALGLLLAAIVVAVVWISRRRYDT
ncbi:MAG TPA: hypothetical protein VGH24_01565 [Solirubrobacteraceae bacterium]